MNPEANLNGASHSGGNARFDKSGFGPHGLNRVTLGLALARAWDYLTLRL